MAFVVTAADRGSFRRCRRQWDFGGGIRQDLEPRQRPAVPDLDRALRDALAVYYYPGMWDWDRGVRLPLVVQGLERAVTKQREQCGHGGDASRWREQLDEGQRLLARYFGWAPTVDQFAPVLIEAEYEVNAPDPVAPAAGLVTGAGEAIRYQGRIDMLAVDQHDAYWIVRHRVVDGDWAPTERLVQDEEAVTACWAWEQFYLGMTITGTIYNEMRLSPPSASDSRAGTASPGRRWGRLWPRAVAAPPAVRQHEPSGGGRSVPQHRRMYARATEPQRPDPIEQRVGDGFRRTWLRRSPAEVAAAGRRLGTDVAAMARPDVSADPNPSDEHCPPCPYLDPCRALTAGADATPILELGYRKRPPKAPEEGRLGGGAWGVGRGAAPPRRSPGT
jgi:hypothetical protein